uniref:Ran-binding protein n=1 Tax=Hemiscolopendra marginata TaxID=943146 RepID=A0A646QHE9_9MYRI
MATTSTSRSGMDGNNHSTQGQIDRLKLLYPMVNEEETPLPRSWSPKDKYNFIGLSQNNLRVHYKGVGKTHKDAASVRATNPIPAACGLYYFEVKIVSKGRDGYMGIGLSIQGVNMNRLPGWDKNSYGYHGDDGNSFCSSGNGQPYGPTFTTGDVIGCGVNLIDNTCFYTKNGHNLGIAFTDLPPNLYPTVGLQTPGEVVDANFGQAPFVFDIEDMMKELRMKTRMTIEKFPVSDKQGEWQTTLHKIVSTYLVHHGYCATAEAFARSTGQAFEEELASIKNRQRIQKLVLAGRMGEAIDTTQKLYPGLLERNFNLLFMLKCRQFVEMVNGTDSEVRPLRSPKSQGSSPSMSPSYYTQRSIHTCSRSSSPNHIHSSSIVTHKPSNLAQTSTLSVEEMNVVNMAVNGDSSKSNCDRIECDENDVDMETFDNEDNTRSNITNGNATNGFQNGENHSDDDEEGDEMDIDPPPGKRSLCGGNQAAIERMLQFGRELQSMSIQLRREQGKNETNKNMLQDAFSLLAYADPWNSPLGYQLDPVQREPACAALNSAILESYNLPRRPPLEIALGHTKELIRLMSKVGLGSCAFANVDDILH